VPTVPQWGAQPRSPERQRLAECIKNHAYAVARYERVNDARGRLDNEFFAKLQPAVRAAMDALASARADEQQRFIDQFLGEAQAGDVPSLAEAEAVLRRAETDVEHAQKARRLMLEEAGRAEIAVKAAERELESSVFHVIFTDPRKAELVAEFQRTGRRLLRLARAMRTINVNADGIISDPIAGLSFVMRIGDIARPGGVGTLYTSDPSWGAAVAALREDPDFQLPALPEPEPPEDDTGQKAA
jgi:hypothetical protein